MNDYNSVSRMPDEVPEDHGKKFAGTIQSNI
jgi:hypothetical protein